MRMYRIPGRRKLTKTRASHCELCALSLLLLFSFGAHAAARDIGPSQLSTSPRLQGSIGNARRAGFVGGSDYSVLYSFCAEANCADGADPHAGLIEDAEGNLYGTTFGGGNSNHICFNGSTCGTVFRLEPPAQQGGTWTETVLYTFCSEANCADGAAPPAGLIEDAEGNLYGTTFSGGASASSTFAGGGTVFKLEPPVQTGATWTENVLYSFCSESNCTDGEFPYAGLIEDAEGNLYGTTAAGGIPLLVCGFDTCGTVFKLEPPAQQSGAWTETVLYNFCSNLVNGVCTDGAEPSAGLVEDAEGNLYGTTSYYGGGVNGGTVFELAGATPSYTLSVNPTSLAIVAGQSGQATITVTPQNGFNSAVNLSCSGLPAESNCSFDPSSVTPTGGSAVTSRLTITTTAPSTAMQAFSSPRPIYAFWLPELVIVFGLVSSKKRAIRRLQMLAMLMVLGLVTGLISCGSSSSGGSGGRGGGNSGTPVGTSMVTVTASASASGAANQTANLTITITP